MSDGYLSDESNNNITVFTSGSEYSSSDEYSSDESEEEYVNKTFSTNSKITNDNLIVSRPQFKYIDHNNYKTSNLLNPDVEYMRNYATRCSKFDLIGVIAKRGEMLSRGAFPLVKIECDDNHKETEIDITLKEIDNGLCPYVIKHEKLLLKLKDLEPIGYNYHINNLKTIFNK